MAAYYLWFKATHIAFMVTWFAGLFYLPRLFIYHAQASDEVSHKRFVIMERRLFAIMTIGALLTVILGVLLMGANPSVASQGWFHVKLVLLLGLGVYHVSCLRWMQKLKTGYRTDNTKGLRWYNEVPAFFLLTIVILAVVKPF